MKKLYPKINIDIDEFGQYRNGLTTSEIKEYLKKRAGMTSIGNLYRKFCTIARVNTVGVGRCEFCDEEFSLMYRWDVERFANVLFLGEKTYFD